MVADRGIRDGESMVFEYLHFLPSQYDKEVLNYPSVIPIVLRLDSAEIHRERVKMRDRKTHLKGDSLRLLNAIDTYRIMQDYQCKDAKKNGVTVVATDDWEKAQDEVFTIIFRKIKILVSSKSLKEPEKLSKLRSERKL